ncbi:hypothetical protein Sste5346_000094 [Sporothrix stenoceras]|uniref:Uncharacterized protein n=1 Tax=Sporothrix stenoceras TaxID=5173 RepID=A0ABR3ZTS9_9PEZI
MGVTTRSQARQEAEKPASASLSTEPIHKNTKTKNENETKAAKGKGSGSLSATRPAKPRSKTRAAPPAVPKDNQAGIIFPVEAAGLDNIAAILEGAGATYKVNWMAMPDGTKYINCIWFDLVTQNTMAQLLSSTDVKRTFFYNEEIERMIEQGVEDPVEGRGWFRHDEYDSDL